MEGGYVVYSGDKQLTNDELLEYAQFLLRPKQAGLAVRVPHQFRLVRKISGSQAVAMSGNSGDYIVFNSRNEVSVVPEAQLTTTHDLVPITELSYTPVEQMAIELPAGAVEDK